MRGGCGFVLGYWLVGLLFQFAFEFVHMPGEDLVACHQSRSFEESVDEAIDAIKRQLDKFKVFIKSENDLGTRRTLCEAVEFVHLVLDEFDQPFVGVEFHGLNLYVHSLTVYKS